MTQLMPRKTGPSHAAAPSPLPQERGGGGSSKKGPAARDGGSYNKEER